MIRIIAAICLLFISTPLIGNTQTVDVSTLSDHEKKLHRWGWCMQINDSKYFDYETWDMDMKELGWKINDVFTLLRWNGAKGDDPNQIYMKVQQDVMKQQLLDEINVTELMLRKCLEDAKQMLRDDYIPYFSYLSE